MTVLRAAGVADPVFRFAAQQLQGVSDVEGHGLLRSVLEESPGLTDGVEYEIPYLDDRPGSPLFGRAPGAGWVHVAPDGLAQEASQPGDEAIRERRGALLLVGIQDGHQQFFDQGQVSRLVIQVDAPVAARHLPEDAGGHLGHVRRKPREVKLKQRGRGRAEKERHLLGYGVSAQDLQVSLSVLRVAHNGGPIYGFAGSPAVPRLRRDLDQEILVVLAEVYGHDHPTEGGFDLLEELDDGASTRLQFSGHAKDRGGTGRVAFDADWTGVLFRSLIYAFFRRLSPTSPEHPASPPHKSANQQILTSARICRQLSHALPLPDAKFARTNPGASRTVDGERQGYLAGPDGLPPFR